VYPANKVFRTYQFKIVRSALFENTLVTLPTGLGKTFIASTVIFNYYRWFRDGLIFFLAPTRPLVT
jgi:ERCC4-related helicase